jgi:MFS family permease
MTENQQWLTRKYIAYRTLTSMWFVGAIWLYFYRVFITDQQVGVLDGMAFAIGLLAEVPSGGLADKFGRDKVVRLGQILAGSGLLIQAVGSSFMPFFVGQAIMMVGVSLVSGADEALFFERLKFSKSSTDWRKLVTRGSQVALIGTVVATIAGGWLHTISPRIPWALNGLVFILAALIIWSVKDDRTKKVRQKFVPELKDYLNNIKTGFAQFRLPKLWLYVPLIVTVQGLFYTTGYGLLRLILLDRFHFSPFWGSVAIASSSLITVGLLAYMHKNADTLSEKKYSCRLVLSQHRAFYSPWLILDSGAM